MGLTKCSTIIPDFKTDHSSNEFTLNIEGNTNESRYWRSDKAVLYDTNYILKIKNSIQQIVQDIPNTDSDILFDIIKCNIRHLSMQYIGGERCKYKQKIDSVETQVALLQPDLMINSSENTVSQMKYLRAELHTIYDNKVKMKMLQNRIAFYEDDEKIINSSSKQASNTILTIQFKNLNNGRIIDQRADILHE